MSELVDLLKDLVAIDSINPALVPGAKGESEIAQFISDWARDAGLEVEIAEPVKGRPSVVAIARGSGGGRSLMLNAHTDTVGVAGMDKPFDPRVEDGKLFGRGAFDMKSGLAAAMIATVRARQMGLRGDVILTAVSDEEHASIGTSSIAERWTADAAIITEPTGLELTVAHKGFIWIEVETHGFAAHGSLPEIGVDAIAKMGRVLVDLETLDRELRSGPRHEMLATGSIHASLISGGQELSSYPDHCRLEIERRTVPGETPEIVERQLQEILDRASSSDPAFRADLTMGLVRDPYEIAQDAPIVEALRRHAAIALEREPIVSAGFGWMDSAILGAAGIPTVIFGPDGAGAHAVEEWVDLASVETCADVLTSVLGEFCS